MKKRTWYVYRDGEFAGKQFSASVGNLSAERIEAWVARNTPEGCVASEEKPQTITAMESAATERAMVLRADRLQKQVES